MPNLRETLAMSCTFQMVQGTLQEVTGQFTEQSELRETPVGTIIDNKYRILGLLGHGGMGAVYKAHHLNLDKDVALKTFRSPDLSPDMWDRFQREAHAIAKLDNKNIVRIFDFGVSQGNQPYYTMELLSGETLAARLKREKGLPVAEALFIFGAVAEGLVSTHAKGIVHRDLKPANILLEVKDNKVLSVKLVDFGLARLSAAGPGESQGMTMGGAIFGSPLYMSPEQSLGQITDARSDIYSFGCAFYEALTGRPPFIGSNAFTTIYSHQTDAAPRLIDSAPDREFPSWLETLVANMLAKRPEKRIQSFEEILEIFELYKKPSRKVQVSSSYRKSAFAEKARTSRSAPGKQFAARAKKEKRAIARLPFLFSLLLIVVIVSILIFKTVADQKQSQLDQAKTVSSAPASADSTKTLRVNRGPKVISYLRAIEQTPEGRFKVFKFSGVNFAQFCHGEGQRKRVIPCVGEVKISADDQSIYLEPRYSDYYKPNLMDGFHDDDIRSIRFESEQVIGSAWGDLHVHCIAHLSGLQQLSVKESEVSGASIEDISLLKSLTGLDISYSRITGRDIMRLANLNQLQSLAVNGDSGLSEFFKTVDKSKLQLKFLSVNKCCLTDSDLIEITKIKTLQSISLDGNDISSAGLKQVSNLPELKVISLRDTKMTRADLTLLAAMKKQRGLTVFTNLQP